MKCSSEEFLHFFLFAFECIVHVFKKIVLLFYRTQWCSKKDVAKTTYMSLIEGSGWGIVSRVPGVGNRPPGKKKTANFRGYVPGGGGAW